MKFTNSLKIIFFSFFLIIGNLSFAQAQRNYLINALQNKPVSNYISNIDNWRKENKEKLKKKIADLPDSVKNKFINDKMK